MGTLMLSHADVVRALPADECVEAMAAVLAAHARGEAFMPLRSVMIAPGAAGFMGMMPGWRGGEDPVFSMKLVCVMPGNPARGLDAHQGVVGLFDGETGMPTAILNASAITQIRTAAVTAVATRSLAREDARVLAILGAGVQAFAHLESLLLVRDFDEVRVYAPTAAHVDAVVARVPAGVRGVAAPRPEDAVRGADVVVVATSSRTPVLEDAWLSEGMHVNAVGASLPTAHEIEVATVARSALFVDSRESLRGEAGEWRLAVEQGAVAGESHIRGELGEVLAGVAAGRRNDTELTLFRSLGLAVEDLAAAEHAVAAARRLGLGTEVEL